MTQKELKPFISQLALWTREIIDHGRTPFRKVETSPLLWTNAGHLRPALVLWINRQSLQAASVIMFSVPEVDVEQQGCACAHALGLRHYVVWGQREINIWQRDGLRNGTIIRTLPVATNDLNDFHQSLIDLLDELKLLAVLGAVPPADLPAEYMVNLCLMALNQQRKPLIECSRVHLAEHPDMALWVDPEQLATQTATAGLLRLLALHTVDALPLNVAPEKLERAMEIAWDQLPETLRPQKKNPLPLPALPHPFAVVLHGVARRLEQVGWRDNRQRAAGTLEQLWPRLQPLWCSFTPPRADHRGLTLEPLHAIRQTTAEEVSLWPGLLMVRALWRHLRNEPPIPQQWAGPLQWTIDQHKAELTINEAGQVPTKRQQQPLANRLRLVWPARRIRMDAGTPAEAFSLLYAMGALETGAEAILHLPARWALQGWWRTIATVITEACSLVELSMSSEGNLDLILTKGSKPKQLTKVTTTDGHSLLPWGTLQLAPAISWALLPLLPTRLLDLLNQGRLCFLDPSARPTPQTMVLFGRTTLAKQQRPLFTSLPKEETEDGKGWPAGFLVPAPSILKQLEQAEADDLDNALAIALGLDTLPEIVIPSALLPRQRRRSLPSTQTVEEALRQAIAERGVPQFPEQYLYQIDRVAMTTYAFTPPLTRTESFFGEVELSDGAGQRWRLKEIHAEALDLASNLGRNTVALPDDEQVLQKMLANYYHDVQGLHHELKTQALAGCGSHRQARLLLDRLWQEHPLPQRSSG